MIQKLIQRNLRQDSLCETSFPPISFSSFETEFMSFLDWSGHLEMEKI